MEIDREEISKVPRTKRPVPPRSVPFLFQPWLALPALALCGAHAAVELLSAGIVAVVWCGLLVMTHFGKRSRYLLCALGLLLSSASYYRAKVSLDAYKQSYHTMRTQFVEPLRCVGTGRVISSPVEKTRLNATSDSEEVIELYTVRFFGLECEDLKLDGAVDVRIVSAVLGLRRGDELEIIAQLAPPRLFRNALLSNPWPGAARGGTLLSGSALHVQLTKRGQGFFSRMDHFRAHVRERIRQTYTQATVPLGRALVLGENDLPEEDAGAFRQSGLLHLLAVSGTHLVIFVLSMVRVLRALLVRIQPLARRFDVARWSSGFGALCSIAYADFSGGSGSAWRATYMLCVVCGSRCLGVTTRGSTALGASLAIGLMVDPHAGSDFSFLLSALATAGLIGLGQPLTRLCARSWAASGPARFLVESLCATLASSLPCAPVLAMMGDSMTWAALVANVVAAPLGEIVALPACLLHAVVSPLVSLEAGLAVIGSGALYGVRAVALFSASVSFARFQVPLPRSSSISLLFGALLLVVFLRWLYVQSAAIGTLALHRLRILLGLSLAFVLGWAHSPEQERAPSQTLTITSLDVGQGDAIFIEFPQGQVALLDGGGFVTKTPDTGARVILPYLRARSITRLDLMIVSHAHPDHILGLLSVAQEVPVKTLWIPDETGKISPRGAGTLAQLMRAVESKGGHVKHSQALCKEAQLFGGTSIEVLAPCVSHQPPLGLNDNSLVVRIRYKNRAALLTGDLEKRGEALLLQHDRARLKADLLKVAHHGSDTSSTPEFLAAVAPEIAFISCGVRNRFRHPRPQTLHNLSAAGIETLRTDRQGSLSWSSDGDTIFVRTFDTSPQLHVASADLISSRHDHE